jgi:photosystem II stability/assembly factor-like uncharacterized protein
MSAASTRARGVRITPWRAATAVAAAALAGVAAFAAAGGGGAEAAPLERPATALRQPQRAALLGLARAGARLVGVGERGAVLLSDDQGGQWRQAAAVPVSVTLTAVQFVDERTGWAVGHQGVVLHTTDGGEHWTVQLDGRRIAQRVMEEARASGDAARQAEAERLAAEGADKPLLALAFDNAREGWVLGAFNLALVTQDGGRSWQSVSARLPNPKGAHLYAMHRQGADLLIAGEQGLVLHSGDGGQRFERLTTPYGGSFFGVAHEADGAWLVAGLRGRALRSRDGGRSWSELASPVPASVTAMQRDDHGQVWMTNQAGQLLRAGSQTLEPVLQTAAQQPAALLPLDRDGWLLAGWSGPLRVTPGVPAARPTP